MELQPHQQRVVQEKQELDEKITKLSAFVVSQVFDTVDPDERERLRQQVNVMVDYSRILGARIKAFT